MDSVEEHRHLGRISFSGGRVMKSVSESVTVVYECRSATIPTPTAALPLLLSQLCTDTDGPSQQVGI